jgi:hypothetical protein
LLIAYRVAHTRAQHVQKFLLKLLKWALLIFNELHLPIFANLYLPLPITEVFAGQETFLVLINSMRAGDHVKVHIVVNALRSNFRSGKGVYINCVRRRAEDEPASMLLIDQRINTHSIYRQNTFLRAFIKNAQGKCSRQTLKGFFASLTPIPP